ncbi:MAG: hypothetical protein WCY88_06655 [Spongiibacteraceae bacterium]
MTILRALSLATLALSLALPLATGAQIYGDYIPQDSHKNNPVNVYFGAVKSKSGDYVEGATMVFATAMLDFVAVTDKRGRYRLELPVDISPSKVESRCSHPDYSSSQIRRRLPRAKALTPVEVDCTLS